MALYNDHLDGIIYKSGFKVDIADAFVDPHGKIILADSFCHCQLAYDIIRQETENHMHRMDLMEREIQRIKKYLSKNEDANMRYNLKRLTDEYDLYKKNGSCKELFDKVHLNKGYDEAEFLVAYLGYIGIEGHYLLYNRKTVNTLQTSAIKCGWEYENGGRIITKS